MKNYRSNYNLIGEKFGKLTVISLCDERYLTPSGNKRKVWECLCECGKSSFVQTNNLCMNRTMSCGCLKWTPEAIQKRAIGNVKEDTGLKEVYKEYRRNAIKRDLEFKIDLEFARILFNGNCYYCNDEPSSIFKKSYIKFKYNGIDRVDNSIGYTKNNCVSCCKICNMFKKNLTYDIFINKIKKIYENKIKN